MEKPRPLMPADIPSTERNSYLLRITGTIEPPLHSAEQDYVDRLRYYIGEKLGEKTKRLLLFTAPIAIGERPQAVLKLFQWVAAEEVAYGISFNSPENPDANLGLINQVSVFSDHAEETVNGIVTVLSRQCVCELCQILAIEGMTEIEVGTEERAQHLL